MHDCYNVINTPFELSSKKRKKGSRKIRRKSRIKLMLDDDYSSDFSVTIIGEPDHTEVFEVEKIIMARYKLDSKKKKKNENLDNFEFLIKWKNYDSDDNTWEPFENLSVNLKGEARKAALKLTEELKTLRIDNSISSNDQNIQSHINQIPNRLINNISYGIHMNSNMTRLEQSVDSNLISDINSETIYNSNLYNQSNINVNKRKKNENNDDNNVCYNNIYNINKFITDETDDISQKSDSNNYDKKRRNLKSIISVSNKLNKNKIQNFENTNNVLNSLDSNYYIRKNRESENINICNNNNEEGDTIKRHYSLDDYYIHNNMKHNNKHDFFDDYKNYKTKNKNILPYHRYLKNRYPSEDKNYNQNSLNLSDDTYKEKYFNIPSKNNVSWEIKENNKLNGPNSIYTRNKHKTSGNKIATNIMDNSSDSQEKKVYNINSNVNSNIFFESSHDPDMGNRNIRKSIDTGRRSKNKQNNDINIKNNIQINNNDSNLSKCNHKNKLNNLNKTYIKNNNEKFIHENVLDNKKCKSSKCFELIRMNKDMLNKYAYEENTSESLLKNMEHIFNKFIELDEENEHCNNSTSIINSYKNSELSTSEKYRNNIRSVEKLYISNCYSKKSDNNNQTKNSYIYPNNILNKENDHISKGKNESAVPHLSTDIAQSSDINSEHAVIYKNSQNICDKRIDDTPTYENNTHQLEQTNIELPCEFNNEISKINNISKLSSGLDNHYNLNQISPKISNEINHVNNVKNAKNDNYSTSNTNVTISNSIGNANNPINTNNSNILYMEEEYNHSNSCIENTNYININNNKKKKLNKNKSHSELSSFSSNLKNKYIFKNNIKKNSSNFIGKYNNLIKNIHILNNNNVDKAGNDFNSPTSGNEMIHKNIYDQDEKNAYINSNFNIEDYMNGNSKKKNNDNFPLNLNHDKCENGAYENISPENRFIRNISNLIDRNNDKCDYYIDLLENVLCLLKEKRMNIQSYNTNNSTPNFMNVTPNFDINKQTNYPNYNNYNEDSNYIKNKCYDYSNKNNINIGENNALNQKINLNKNKPGFDFEQKQTPNNCTHKKNNNLAEFYQHSQLYNNQNNYEHFCNEQNNNKRKKNIRKTSQNTNCNTDSNNEYINNYSPKNFENNNRKLNCIKKTDNNTKNDIPVPNIINKKHNDKKRKIEIKNISTFISKICKNNKEMIEENDEQNWKNNKKNVRKIRKKINVDKMINTNDSSNDQNISFQNNTMDKENSEQDEKNKYTILHALDINAIKENYMKKYSEYVESINKLALSNIDALIKNINIINFYNRKTENNINFIKGKFQIHLIESYTNILLYFDIFNDFKNYNFIYKNCEFLNTLFYRFCENISENKNHNLDTSTNELSKNIILFNEIYKLNQKLNEFFKEQFLLLNLKPKLLYFPSPNYFMCFYVHLSAKTDYNHPCEDEEDCAITRVNNHSKHINSNKEHDESLNNIRDNNTNNNPDDACKDLIGTKHSIPHTQINSYFIDGSNKKFQNDSIAYNNDNYITRQNEEDNKSEYNSIITNDSFSANCNDVITDNELDNTLDHAVISENGCSNSNKKPNNELKNIDHGNYTTEVTHHVVACDEMKQTKYKDTKFQSKYDDSQFNKFEYQTDTCENDNFKTTKSLLKHNLNNNRKSIFNSNSYILCGNDSNKNKLSLNEDVRKDDCKMIEGSNDSLKVKDFMQNSRVHENNSNANKPNCIQNSQIKFCINTDHGNNKANIINNEKIDSEKSTIFKDSQNNLNDNILHLTNSGKGISYHELSFMSANEQSDHDENNNDDNDTEDMISPFDGTKMKLCDSVQESNDFQSSPKEEGNYLCKGKNEPIYENDNTNNAKNEYDSVENMDNINANFNKSDFTDSNNNMDKPSNIKPNSSNNNIRINLNIQSLYDAYVNLNDSSKNNNNYYDSYLPHPSAYNKYTDDKKNINNNILKEDIKNVLYNWHNNVSTNYQL
ncbi:conserved Plasmodium protein, unknown function [Plasmodium berghei]|uniref:Chromo domain-containing protein n=1 Tax=Plasmodium berghei TaxID=5821 RepID=A0A113RLT1_PLABE|nr:conserved Plasmodium protein, unknown function [Plasmodium berghei]SCO60101.1 conserved Plasmodium protein, unknown function [Plasmodium berghei]